MSERRESRKNICLSCGACCAAYRVTFYWYEAKKMGLEEPYIEKFNSWRVCMSGTRGHTIHCRALQGVIGREVYCTVYANRPSPCRELHQGGDKCNRARAKHGLDAVDNISPMPQNISLYSSDKKGQPNRLTFFRRRHNRIRP